MGAGDRLRLDEAAQRHLRVLRMREGHITLFDGEGRLADARIEGQSAVLEEVREAPRLHPRVVLLQATPKGAKADEIIRGATELGVAEIRFVTTARSVPKLDARRAAKRTERWRRIATEAARQSERAWMPLIAPPAPLEEAIRDASGIRWVAWARGGVAPIASANADSLFAAVGPEGGFTKDELAHFERSGWTPVRLSPTVLRTETAALAVLAHAAASLREGDA